MNQDLPEPDFSFDCDGTPCYYASTVRRLIKEARDMALEDAAKVCDEAKTKSRNHLFRSGLSIAAGAIRQLKD